MKMKYCKILIFLFVHLNCFPNLFGQNLVITDTVKPNIPYLKSDTSFVVEGEVLGMDSGSMKVSSEDKGLVAYVPFRQGKFYFSGLVKALEQLRISIKGDYYNNVFYAEPGQIRIKYIYHDKFTASGTIENDLSNYFKDTLNKKNNDRFWELSNNIELAQKSEDLGQYLNLIDSFTIVEKDFFKTVNDAIAQKRLGDYLLGYINYYYINYGHFKERKSIYDKLPDNIKNSSSGKQALDFLIKTEKKNVSYNNEPAYQFTLNDIKNKPFALKKFKGKIIVLDFWASWCLPCIKALPLLKKIHSNDVSKNVVYVSVSIDKKENDWRTKEKIIQIPWLSLLADTSTVKHYEIDAVPSYIIINKEGKIASKGSSLGNLYTKLKELQKMN